MIQEGDRLPAHSVLRALMRIYGWYLSEDAQSLLPPPWLALLHHRYFLWCASNRQSSSTHTQWWWFLVEFKKKNTHTQNQINSGVRSSLLPQIRVVCILEFSASAIRQRMLFFVNVASFTWWSQATFHPCGCICGSVVSHRTEGVCFVALSPFLGIWVVFILGQLQVKLLCRFVYKC